jgi:hypothetical protein
MRSVGVAVLGFCALFAVCAGVARATGSGGNSIATAPIVPAGVQQVGSTATFTDSCGNGFEFWTLQLEQGDVVKITWGRPAAVDTVALWSAGTLDSAHDTCIYDWSHWTASPVLADSNTTATDRVSQVHITQDGTYPLLFVDTTGGPNAGSYSFTATVLHEASVTLPRRSAIFGSGTLKATVAAPDNDLISDPTLKLALNGYWSNRPGKPPRAHRLATSTPTNGTATFDYSLPASLWGKKIRIGVSGGGSNYQPVASRTEPVEVRVPTGVSVLASAAELTTASRLLRQSFYWAGTRKGFRYEFTRTTNGYVYVRYLPRGVRAGDPRARFLIVATYPFRNAYATVKKYAKGKAVAGPNGSIYFVRPNDPKSVLVAFPNVDDEIEVYDHSPAVARAIAADGRVRPVR